MTYVSPVSVELAAPESVGIDPGRLRLLLDRVQLEVDEGPLPSAQVVLTHTAGFPFAPLGYPKMLDRQKRLEAFA